jgi:hypothetical protein
MQTTEVEEVQELVWQFVLPRVTVFVNDASPKLNPLTTIGVPPTKAAFPITCKLNIMFVTQGAQLQSSRSSPQPPYLRQHR